MAEIDSFVYNQKLRDLEPALYGGRRIHDTFAAIQAEIQRRCGEDVALLFAKPVDARDPETGAATIAWHWKRGGVPEPIIELDSVAREAAIARLRDLVTRLCPVLRDPSIGPIVSGYFNIRSNKDIVRIGRDPVIFGWGLLPKEIARDPRARKRHFEVSFSNLLPPILPTPPFEESEFSALQSAISRTPMAAAESPSTKAPDQGAPSASLQVSSHAAWRAPLVATAIAAGILLSLSLPGVLGYPETGLGQDFIDRATAEEQERNEALRQRLDQLREAINTHQCRLTGELDPLHPILSPIPERVQVDIPPASVGGTTRTASLAELVDKTTVLVISMGNESLGTGSGFFINDGQIVTNYHVIENALHPSGKTMVYNRIWGDRPIPASVVAHTGSSRSEEGDFAVLQIDGVQGQLPAALGTNAAKLEQVIAAGYPSYLTTADDGFSRLMNGEPGAAVDPYVLTGTISRVHQETGSTRLLIGHTAQIGEGSSGGPLFNSCGRVVGVNTFGVISQGGNDSLPVTRVAPYALSSKMLVAFLDSKGISFQAEDRNCQEIAAASQTPVPSAPTEAPPSSQAEATPANPAGPNNQ